MSAPLSSDVVTRVAQLARLKLSDPERERMASQLARVLEYVAVLNEVDVDGVEPMAHAVELANVLRDDRKYPSLPREDALANAPKTDGECFLVPAILDQV